MKLAIVSDSHDNRTLLEAAVIYAKARGAEAVLHCGDVVAPSTLNVLHSHWDYRCMSSTATTAATLHMSRIVSKPSSVV